LKWSQRVKPSNVFGASTRKKSDINGEMLNSLIRVFLLWF
jgi:hypothetical protein